MSHVPKHIQVVVVYIIVGGLWVLLADRAILTLTKHPDGIMQLAEYRGFAFIAMTAAILYFERKHADEKQKKIEERFRTMADFTYDWEYWVGPNGRFMYVSPSVERITGYRADEFIKTPELARKIIHPDDRELVSRHMREVPKEGAVTSLEFRIIARNGEERWIGHVCQHVYDKQGNPAGIRASNRDITERKHVEELERVHREKMGHADKMITLGTLVAGVAHEINNPTNFITLNAPILREYWQGTQPLLEKYYQEEGEFSIGRFPYTVLRDRMELVLDGVTEGAERITGIVANLKDFARPDPSDMHQEVDLNQVIHNAVTLLKSSIEKRTRHFHLSSDERLPTIVGSSQKLEQVMINLIQNSLEALSDESQAVSVSSRYEKTQNTIIIEVKDEGDGIAEDILPRILDPFFTTKRISGGTGLGLAIVAGIVKNHGGELRFSSASGKGTSATITLEVEEP